MKRTGIILLAVAWLCEAAVIGMYFAGRFDTFPFLASVILVVNPLVVWWAIR